MSAVAEGQKLAGLQRDINTRLQDGVVTGGAPGPFGQQGGAAAGEFPRKFDASDKMDDLMRLRMQLSDAQGRTPFGELTYTDDVGRWLERKAAAAENANFDAWFGQNYHKNDLASRQFAQEINPDYYRAREKEMMARTKEALAIKLIQLRGPRTKEDLYRVFLLNTGRIQLPQDWDRIGVNVGPGGQGAQLVTDREDNFKRGLVRLPRLRNNAQRARAEANPPNPFGQQGASTNAFPEQQTGTATNNLFSRATDPSLMTSFMQSNLYGV